MPDWALYLLILCEAVGAALFMFTQMIFSGASLLVVSIGWGTWLHVMLGENPIILILYILLVLLCLAWEVQIRKRTNEPTWGNGSSGLSDKEFIQQFEKATLPEECFHHTDHIRLAWLYLRQYSVPQVLERYSRGIRNFAKAHGNENLYHETITWAYIFLIKERMEKSAPDDDWAAFADKNPDLLRKGKSALNRYYAKDVLTSDRARKSFLLPDPLLKALD